MKTLRRHEAKNFYFVFGIKKLKNRVFVSLRSK